MLPLLKYGSELALEYYPASRMDFPNTTSNITTIVLYLSDSLICFNLQKKMKLLFPLRIVLKILLLILTY